MAVFYLKYRPSNWSELDLTDVAVKIQKALDSEHKPQSYLFTGPKGAGKTSAARILAKSVNCLKPEKGEPCNKCENCKEIDGGASLDVIELDGASNRGIDDVRELKDKVNLMPSKLKYKVFIFDEVHMLTKEAFNALLKLLEEPPKHTMFVLCTTEEGKIPETIMSRLMKVEFRKGGREELKKSLDRIIEGEGLKVADEVMEMFLERSDGSFRNLQRMFNEVYVDLGGEFTKEKVATYLSKGNVEYGFEILEKDLAIRSKEEIIKKFEKMAEVGFDFSNYRERAISYFQKKMVGVMTGEKCALELSDLTKWLNLLIIAGKQEKEAVIGQLPMELAVVEFCGEKTENSDQKTVDSEPEKEEEYVVEGGGEGVVKVEDIEKDWGKLLVAVKPFNHSVEAFLRAARPLSVRGKIVTMEVFYPFHKDKLEEPKNRQIVEAGIKKVWNAEVEFRCVLGRDKKPPLVINNSTPMSEVTGEEEKKDIYDVAKEIFG